MVGVDDDGGEGRVDVAAVEPQLPHWGVSGPVIGENATQQKKSAEDGGFFMLGGCERAKKHRTRCQRGGEGDRRSPNTKITPRWTGFCCSAAVTCTSEHRKRAFPIFEREEVVEVHADRKNTMRCLSCLHGARTRNKGKRTVRFPLFRVPARCHASWGTPSCARGRVRGVRVKCDPSLGSPGCARGRVSTEMRKESKTTFFEVVLLSFCISAGFRAVA